MPVAEGPAFRIDANGDKRRCPTTHHDKRLLTNNSESSLDLKARFFKAFKRSMEGKPTPPNQNFSHLQSKYGDVAIRIRFDSMGQWQHSFESTQWRTSGRAFLREGDKAAVTFDLVNSWLLERPEFRAMGLDGRKAYWCWLREDAQVLDPERKRIQRLRPETITVNPRKGVSSDPEAWVIGR